MVRPCARCGGGSFVCIAPARLPDGQSANGTLPLAVGALYAQDSTSIFARGTMHSVQVDATVCEGCGAVALTARDVEAVRTLVELGAARRVTVT